MKKNPLVELGKMGQSIWYDQMERALITSGKLKQMIEEDDLRGLTSNPTIFDKAIAGSDDYNEQVRDLAAKNKSRNEIYQEIVIDDISHAADIFKPVYDKTKGLDGFVSLEVSPTLAHDTVGTIAEAKNLFEKLGKRPNVMIKIPATPEGLPAIEEAIAAGINVNVTLIFSNDVYVKVAEAYIRGLERRAEQGQPLNHVRSVASFFVSRIDTAVDKILEEKIAKSRNPVDRGELESLLGKTAIANAKLAYQAFKEIFAGERFKKLSGAHVQRPLWASTGTKNPKYGPTYYVDALIGPETVDTIPPATYDAFREQGTAKLTLEEGVAEARAHLKALEKTSVSLSAITEKLTAEGVKSFAASFESLMATIESRRVAATNGAAQAWSASLGEYDPAVREALSQIQNNNWIDRIWQQDTTVWKRDEAHRKIIENALGWLPVVAAMQGKVDDLLAFVNSVKAEFKDVVVLGMGGSSLCPEVLRRAFSKKEGYPALHVLDSTVPAAVRNLENQLDLAATLFIVASKSGGTTEPQMFHRYFYERVKSLRGARVGENFIAITDPDTQLKREAERDQFRKIFINPADIGGRYSALSYFGMVPAALSGIDVRTLLARANDAAQACTNAALDKNPGAQLGAILGALAKLGRDKLTLITPRPLDALGLWIEQLVAESTGKEGKGIVPIAGVNLLSSAEYSHDRLFVFMGVKGNENSALRARLADLKAAGHPVVERCLNDVLDLGAVFFTWEFATAIAGALLGINPFDQPNVQESKDYTKKLLEEYKAQGRFSLPTLVAEDEQARLYADRALPKQSVEEALSEVFRSVKDGDYVALLNYIEETPEHDQLLDALRTEIVRTKKVAVTTGYGPRFLHSTGQLHKGGADNGVFLQITSEDKQDLAIPGETFSFGILKEAQSLGDFLALASRKRRVIRIHLKSNIAEGLRHLLDLVQRVV